MRGLAPVRTNLTITKANHARISTLVTMESVLYVSTGTLYMNAKRGVRVSNTSSVP